ncbi:hypothetical protein KRE47_07205 [Elizabethkingia meningoseptica]|nr:hypothetical protein [Elizabethkingia meningoseptica]EJK5330163.1 hypothetical protein [Elizabethkingia meningoseptica]MDE5431018.1 hypothetical protein [Elizabethkingia meningoseptica]MDE5467822.1 hypothetical protein [Elizabethkingia meningoseptica]MDE5474741.1 hypothetical protein [Elizabethkingia meningoseptica]MDE5478174.1 hypothetical protein [Elizabethkingia meningoseptica]
MKKEMNNKETVQEKSAYIAPTLEVTIIKMEQGIAAGSASVRPTDPFNNPIREEWKEEEQSGGIDW